MTRVNFYLLPNDDMQQRLQFTCRLTGKAYRLGKQVFIHTNSEQETQALDKLLWTFQKSSFLPHCIHREGDEMPPPVTLAHDSEPVTRDVLINLADDVPLFFSRFDRVAELINQDTTIKQQGRVRYSFYKERGYPMETHTIDK
ncbi:MAG: DNA polymerase III subunit chi [Gammaproteobacteria bacterium]